MADRKPPGFTIPLGFYDGPEVLSMPARNRAAAVGVWALCGVYSAAKLTDGYVDADTVRRLGCGAALRAVLMNTRGHDGELDPLWIEGRNGGIQFTKWDTYQRSRAEVTAYKDAEAARKREARRAAKAAAADSVNDHRRVTDESVNGHRTITDESLTDHRTITDESVNPDLSSLPAETSERPPGHLPDNRDPYARARGVSKTETETKYYEEGYVSHSSQGEQGAPEREERGQERGRSDPVDVSASRLVATLVPQNTPAAIKTKLRLEASQLMVGDGMASEVVAEALRRLVARSDAGPGLLPHIAWEVQREGNGSAPKSKARTVAEWALEARQQEQHQQPSRKAIES